MKLRRAVANINWTSFTLTGGFKSRSLVLGVLSLLGFRYDAKKRPSTNFIFAGHPHIGDSSRDNYFNYKVGLGQMIIDMTEPKGYGLFETIV